VKDLAKHSIEGFIQPKGFPRFPKEWSHQSGTLYSESTHSDIYYLEMLRVEDTSKVKNVLIIVHGHGEHIGRYLHFPHYLRDTVDAVVGFDHYGHGKSQGTRGHIESFDCFIETLDQWVKEVAIKYAQAKIHLFAHSLGGLIALKYLSQNVGEIFSSVCLSAPALQLKLEVPIIKKVAAYLLTQVWGSLQIGSEVRPDLLSHDPCLQEAYLEDKLIHHKATPRFFIKMQVAMEEMKQYKGKVHCPLMWVLPMKDGLIDTAVTLECLAHFESSQVVVKKYENFFHESFNEQGKESAFKDLNVWIKSNS